MHRILFQLLVASRSGALGFGSLNAKLKTPVFSCFQHRMGYVPRLPTSRCEYSNISWGRQAWPTYVEDITSKTTDLKYSTRPFGDGSNYLHSLASTPEKLQLLKLDFGICSSPPPKKKVNEDAWILYDSGDSCTIGVADGVSSWRRNGVNVEMFSNQLACNISILADNWCSQFLPSPSFLLNEAYEQMCRNREAEGSCTVSVGVIDKINGMLSAATLGDCGFRVIRDNKVIMQSEDQYVSLCIPYQLGIMPHWCQASLDCKSFKKPSDADVKSVKLQHDDFIVFGSDGLFDNLWNEEILEILSPEDLINQRYDLNRAAKALVFYAHRSAYGGLLDRRTPHAHKMCKGCPDCLEDIYGGNIDDVTACIAHIKM